jgi:hypothetical protein
MQVTKGRSATVEMLCFWPEANESPDRSEVQIAGGGARAAFVCSVSGWFRWEDHLILWR